nr:hypothetical protein [Tanacetum cinerariifolium]
MPEHQSDIFVTFTVMMEIILEPTSSKLLSKIKILDCKHAEGTAKNSQDNKVEIKMEMEIPRTSGVYLITACSYSTDTSKELMKVQVTSYAIAADLSEMELKKILIEKMEGNKGTCADYLSDGGNPTSGV